MSLLALRLARALAQRVAPLGLTVTDAVKTACWGCAWCAWCAFGDAELGLWRLAASYPAAQTEVLAVLPKLAAPPLLSLGKPNRRRLKKRRQRPSPD